MTLVMVMRFVFILILCSDSSCLLLLGLLCWPSLIHYALEGVVCPLQECVVKKDKKWFLANSPQQSLSLYQLVPLSFHPQTTVH